MIRAATAAARPSPVRGDWFRALASLGGRCWLLAPSENTPVRGPKITHWEGRYLGPVHDVDLSQLFTAVLVPHPDDVEVLVWVNVWTSRNLSGEYRGVSFCSMVPRVLTDDWHLSGGEDRYKDGC